ncbi:LuxR family transcriptional regulator [Arthrobacter crusticola]|uniref:LuxR family transcriptional regulator n=1 Tax=Arthrobacter crusticola TaxID=2547960 RepID=A0A4R5TZY8_9MICC|nr:LuxR family transcriptional regulator [Arthrobacter crusticola]TDK26835.1 LuxR family transcriptional regulator [Arthrobacter crusticola]
MMRIQEGVSLVGRTKVIDGILTALHDPAGFGAMVVGEPGVGKTALAHAVVQQLGGAAEVFPITGGSSLRRIPFGALSPYLQGLSVEEVGSPVAILRSLMKHLPAPRGRSSLLPLFVVDDAHELDESTCALLAQLVSARRARLLILSRAAPHPPAEFLALSRDGLLVRFDLEPLDASAVDELCRQVLGGNVLTGTSNLLAGATGGNPLFLLTLLTQGRGQGYLVERNGVWRMVGQPSVDLRLVDLIQSQLRQRSAPDLAALEVVALAEPIALNALSRCADPDSVRNLQDDQLITVGPAPERVVSLSHPLYSEVLRTSVPTARSIAIRRAVLEVLDPRTESLEGFLRSVAWGLDCGVPPDDQSLLRAAVVANRLNDPGFALRAARAVSAPGLRGRALVEIARAQIARGNLGYARELVDEARLRCTNLLVAKEATLLSFDIRLRLGESPEDLRRDIDQWDSLIEAIESTGRSRALPDAAATSHLGARLLRCYVLLLEGQLHGLERPLRDAVESRHGSAETRTGALALLGELLASTGRPVSGAACTAEALALIDAEDHQLLTYREFVASRHILSLVHAGEWNSARAVFENYARHSPRNHSYFAGWSDLFEGIAALRSGRTGAARDRLLLAVEGLRESDVTQVLTMATGLAAFACAAASDTTRAKTLIDEYTTVPKRGSREMRLTGRIYALAAGALFGESHRVAAELRQIADGAAADGMLEVAATALEQAARLGDSGAFAPLAELTGHFEGREGAVLNAFAAAARDQDPVRLAEAATTAEEAGYLPLAGACLRLAAELWTSQGAGQKARNAQTRLTAVLSRTDQPAAGTAGSAPGTRLTRREQDIVSLVAEGYSNRDIAERQNVSVRTVEGHLYRIFAKLGINRREELQHSQDR